MRASNRRRPTNPSDSAAMAGGITADAAPNAACAATTGPKWGKNTITTHAAATSSPEAATSARLALVESTSAPAGT